MARMSEADLRAIVSAKHAASIGFLNSEFMNARVEAMRFYRGDLPIADEVGMSGVVSRDVNEAVESLMPALLKPFVAGDRTVECEPVGDEDEEAAKQATEYLNYIFTKKNDGFRFIYDTMKDALLLRIGVAKTVREEYTVSSTENYEGLDDLSLQALGTIDEIVIGKKTQDPMTGLWSVEAKRNKAKARICNYVIPPDEFLFERQLASLDDAMFLGHRTRKAVADLIAMGLDEDKCLDLPEGDMGDYSADRLTRFETEGALQYGESSTDPLARMVWVTEIYLRCDYSGTGDLEWRRVIIGGPSDEILLNEEADGHPFAAWTPIPIPHKLVGMSLHDQVRDIQIVKTALQREQLNNIYLTNRPQREVVEGMVNIDDLLTPRVGGAIRVKQPGMIREQVVPYTAAASGELIQYWDTERESRTGVTRYNQGMDADSLNKTATGIQIISNAAQQRQELTARLYAEFLKRVFRNMLALVCKYPDDAEVMRLRGKVVRVDPREWSDQYDMTVNVGLGTGDKQQQVAMLTNLLALDEKIVQLQGGANGPIVTMENVYNKLERMKEAMGLKGGGYYSDPAAAQDEQQQPQGPDPQAMAQQQAMEAQQQAEQAKLQADMQKAQDDNQARVAIAHINAASAERIARQNNVIKLMLAGMNEAAAEAAVDDDGEEPADDAPQANSHDDGAAVSSLSDAIALHEKHMNGTAPTTGPDGERSQVQMMGMMQSALSSLTGADSAPEPMPPQEAPQEPPQDFGQYPPEMQPEAPMEPPAPEMGGFDGMGEGMEPMT